MAFVQAINAPDLTKKGVNGADVYTEEGVGDYRVTLFTMLNRGLEASYIEEYAKKIFSRGNKDEIIDLFVMAFQTRDIRGGKGERQLFYNFINALYSLNKDAVKEAIHLIPEYGCWRDMWEIVIRIPELEEDVFVFVKKTFSNDYFKYLTSQESKMSLLAKWLPREGSGNYKGLARKLANYLFKSETSERKRLVRYRKETSMMNKALKTVEINMCAHTWKDIKPDAVPGCCMKNHKKAFLNQPLKAKGEELRYPDSEDRMECREHFLTFIEGLKNGTKTVKGANVIMPHELIGAAVNCLTTDEEYEIIEGQWKSIREETLKLGGLGKCVPMCDFSGSMDGTPKLVSLALGILISEINHSAFRDHIIGFDANPKWHSLSGMKTLREKVKSMECSLGQGLNTDFYKACMCIIKKMKEHKVPVGEEPEDLIVLTDMGFDSAHVDYYNNYKSPKWESQLELIHNEFKKAGEEVWGVGNGWKAPRIVVWNLRAQFKDFHATADQEGVVQLSGWSPSILKALQKGGVQLSTPYKGMRIILDDARYDAVRDIITNII
jgi:hypothetical protein